MSTAATTTLSLSSYATLFVGLLAIMNPLGNAAIFLSLTHSDDTAAKNKIARTCAIAVAIILLVTIWFGGDILKLFGISTAALTVAGGLVVLLIGLKMLSSDDLGSSSDGSSANIGIVPLAIPLISGPGAMATILAHSYLLVDWRSKCLVSVVGVTIAILVAMAFICANKLTALMGTNGLSVVTRIMGLLIAAIAVHLLATGLPELFPVLAMTGS